MLERKAVYDIETIRELTKDYMNVYRKTYALLDGDEIKVSSQRYKVFFTLGCDCDICGSKGSFFAKERTLNMKERYHLNLYAIDENGEEVLMTKDHIIPKSKGGKNTLDNYQQMCVKCNVKKGNTI